ncbi:MAG: biopolymer transporter ExbB [Paracoccaceae bacterium]|nr:biopolymer transporter ExbB [Paracoccaceae bacterium]
MFGEDKFRYEFTHPVNQILTMLVLTVLVGVGSYIIYPSVGQIFTASPYLNGFIVGVFVCGLLSCFWRVFALITSVNWIEGFAGDRPGYEASRPPALLAPLAVLLGTQGARAALTTFSARSILDSVATRIDEGREITRYIINLLIFLGLLGTFYGLATSVPAVVDTIRSLAPGGQGEDGLMVFNNLMKGLETQLGGMGTAFGSSLLGLAGSLVVGLLDLFAGHGQNRFYRELEEWISSITRIGISAGETDARQEFRIGDAPGSRGAVGTALVPVQEEEPDALSREQWVELVATLSAATETFAERQTETEHQIERIANLVERLTDQSYGQPFVPMSDVLAEVAESQRQIADSLARRTSEELILDSDSRSRLRGIEAHLLRILEEMSVGRQDSIADLRADLAVLISTLQVAMEGQERD